MKRRGKKPPQLPALRTPSAVLLSVSLILALLRSHTVPANQASS